MSYAVDIHLAYAQFALRTAAEDGTREVSAVMDYESGK
ncbi:hypothetical protein [Enterobacter cloacae complex sp. 288G10]